MPRRSGFVPTVVGGFTIIDGRQTHRCTGCGAYVETRDKAMHRAFHLWLEELASRIVKLENPAETLFDNEPPF